MSSESPRHEKLFGTDGIRGTPGVYPLTDGMIFKIGMSIAKRILYKKPETKRHTVVIGRDTRATGGRIETILADAIAYYGIDVLLTGVITTPGLSFLVKDLASDMGIVISASHNKSQDNGLKFFNSQGMKLPDEEEEWLEDIIYSHFIHAPNGSAHLIRGKISRLDVHNQYLSFLLSTARGYSFEGLHVVIDCGWGAASPVARTLFEQLGAKVTSLHDEPVSGRINEGGALEPHTLRQTVLEQAADCGIAFDGDGDRAVFIDEKGAVLHGDDMLAILGGYLLNQGKLTHNILVTSVMSNLGLKLFLENKGGQIISTQVGDKHVVEEMIKREAVLGGETSGHIIFMEYLPTSDGLLTALQVLKVIKDTGARLSQLSKCMQRFPQVLLNVQVKEKKPFKEMSALSTKLAYFDAQLKGEGRIFLRYSGTENLARVMVEGKDKDTVESIAEELAEEIRKEVGVDAEGFVREKEKHA
jgi:phosphoglucosamine mutase